MDGESRVDAAAILAAVAWAPLPVGGGKRLNVVGGASLDLLRLSDSVVRAAGGAGLYTALAARRAGVEVTMMGPRPNPMPTLLAPAAVLLDWRGARVPPTELPHFEISYDERGSREVEVLSWGAESRLDPDVIAAELPPGPVYVIPLTDPRLQLEILRRLKAAARWVACGTYPLAVSGERRVVRRVLDLADAFFCSEREAAGLFGELAAATAPGKLLFVTRGREGATVYQGCHATRIDAVKVAEVDATGAGDAFCGATLAGLLAGRHPVAAGREGAAMAAVAIGEIGPQALLAAGSPPRAPVDRRVVVVPGQIERIGDWLAATPAVEPFDFCGESFPPPADPGALDFFFAQTLQQFGFWVVEQERYDRPMVAMIDGRSRKGSDYLWAAYRRWLRAAPNELTPAGQRRLERSTFDRRLRSDGGANPLPAGEHHLQLARAYGADMEELGATPATLLASANAEAAPVAGLLRRLDHVAGYKEDPLRKKSSLLSLVLQQRPEGFLRRVERDEVPPIVDYHIQRSCLRMGLVRVTDDDLRRRLEERSLLSERDESAVRACCYRAVEGVQRQSGKSMAAVDWFFFQNRRRCPEMSTPDCRRCEAEAVCERLTELFQPVRRTTFY